MSDPQHKQLRPGNRAATGDRIKLHLRLLRLNGKTWRVLTLRPGTEAAFSNNYFHYTWHFISDKPGAQLLGRILWGLSYQREPNTVFLLHGEHLKPTPFEAEPSLPFVFLPTNISAPDPQAFAELRKMLPRLPDPTATVRLQTWGLDELLADEDDLDWTRYGLPHRNAEKDIWGKERVTLCGGVIAYCAPSPVLRVQAYQVHEMHYWATLAHENGTDYHGLAEHADREQHLGQGEVQIFSRYKEMLSEASEARRDVAHGNKEALPAHNRDVFRETIWKKADIIATRRLQDKHRHRKNS